MHARICIVCAPLLLACPRPTDTGKTDDAADRATTGAVDTSSPAPAPKPTGQDSETGTAASGDACAAEIKAMRDATDQVEQCVGGL